MVTLRDYQEEMLQAVLAGIKSRKDVLIQAATGAGKTIFFSALIRHCMERYNMRICVLVHRETLARQAYDKLVRVWPKGREKIGMACKSACSKVDLEKPVIIASRQTVSRTKRLEKLPTIHMLIVDEAHNIPSQNVKSDYRKIIEHLRGLFPDMRLVGVTATPYRLSHGYIYGALCRGTHVNWFPNLAYQVSIKSLVDKGYLVPYVIKSASTPDLSRVGLSGNGDYNIDELGDVMNGTVQLKSAVFAVQDYAKDRKHIVVFAVTIEHAEALEAEFKRAGMSAVVVHSEMAADEKRERLAAFDAGRVRIIVNVGILTEGWDCMCVDCILLCRPTMSPALYVQMVGRGLRLDDGKTDCLVLDMSGNFDRHGDPNAPEVDYDERKGQSSGQPKEEGEGPALVKCPNCGFENRITALYCADCKQPLKQIVDERLAFHDADALNSGDISATVTDTDIMPYTSRNGNYMLKVSFTCQPDGGNLPVVVNEFWDFEGNGSTYGRGKARDRWMMYTDAVYIAEPIPETVDDAFVRSYELKFPARCVIAKKDGWWKIRRWLNDGTA